MPGATGHCQSTALPYKHLRYDYLEKLESDHNFIRRAW